MRCKCCNTPLTSFDDLSMCKACINHSKDETTKFKDPQHALITDEKFKNKYRPHRPQ